MSGPVSITQGDNDSLLIRYADGSVMRIDSSGARINNYDITSGDTNDGDIDAAEMLNNPDSLGRFLFTDSTGGSFTITAGGSTSLLITRDNGEVIRVPDSESFLNIFDVYTTSGTSGGANDGTIDIEALSNNTNNLGLAKLTDSTGGGFTVTSGSDGFMIIERDNGDILRVRQTIDSYDTYTTSGTSGGTNDGIVDVEAIASNLDSGSITQFIDSSGGSFTFKNSNNNDSILERDNGETLIIADSSTLTTYDTLDGGADDGVIDVDALNNNIDTNNIYRLVDSGSTGFSVERATSEFLTIVRDNGDVLLVNIANLNSYDVYTTSGTSGGTNDGEIDVAALEANTNFGDIYQFTDSSGGSFTVGPGDSNTMLITRDDGTVLRIGITNRNTYDSLDGSDDGVIDLAALDANIDSLDIYRFSGFVCFAKGTHIRTANGDDLIQNLKQGDLVETKDNGLQPIRWIGRNTLPAGQLAEHPDLRPIRIRAGALGHNTPERDLLVSPQHRVLVRSRIAQRMFSTDEVLVAAKQLVILDGIDVAQDIEEMTYYHFLFDQHEVVISNGAETESLYTGPQALKSVSLQARVEILSIFPELRDIDYNAQSCRKLINGRMGRRLAARHKNNNKPLWSRPVFVPPREGSFVEGRGILRSHERL